MPLTFLSSILGLFTGRFKAWAWGIIVLIIIGLFAWWSIHTISVLKQENAQIVLKTQNDQLQANIAAREAEQKELQSKTSAIADSITTLNQKIAANSATKQQNINSMTGPVTPNATGTGIDTQPLEDKANTGMNGLFQDLVVLSQPEKTK